LAVVIDCIRLHNLSCLCVSALQRCGFIVARIRRARNAGRRFFHRREKPMMRNRPACTLAIFFFLSGYGKGKIDRESPLTLAHAGRSATATGTFDPGTGTVANTARLSAASSPTVTPSLEAGLPSRTRTPTKTWKPSETNTRTRTSIPYWITTKTGSPATTRTPRPTIP
jgi:hypothetical protein